MPPSIHEIIMGPEGKYFGPLLGRQDDDDARERYRAWLVEHGDERAELFAIEDSLLRDDFADRARAIARAKEILAKSRNTRDWWRILTRSAPIRNCGSSDSDSRPVRFAYECPRTWETLAPTDDSGTRHCDTCRNVVYLCRSREEAEQRAVRGECITIRAPSWDAISREMTSGYMGRPDPIAIWAERVFPGESSDG